MPIPQQPQQSNAPAPDMSDGPGAGLSMTPSAPQQPAPDMSVNNDGSQPAGNPGANPDTQYQQRLSALPDQDKQFIATMTTPEVAKYVGLVTGDQGLGDFLGKYSDQRMVLVPVPRDKAQAYLQQQQQAQNSGDQGTPNQAPQSGPPSQMPQAAPQGAPAAQPQGQPQPAPQAQAAPNMAPAQMPQAPQHPLPNGVTPAPMQHGIMAPH